jgi:tetratricopeptide (TPR) repeat protein
MPTFLPAQTRKWTATAAAGLLLAPAVQGQAMLHRMADKYAAQFDFNSMAKVYEDIVAKPSAKPADYRKLAFAYKKAGNTPQAAATYKRLLDLGSPASDDMHAYADLLRAQGRYAEAVDWYRKYAAEEPEDELGAGLLEERRPLPATARRQPAEQRAPIGPEFHPGRPGAGPDGRPADLQQCTRRRGRRNSTPYKWDEQPFLNLYSADAERRRAAGPLGDAHDVNSRYHDGTATFDSYQTAPVLHPG